MAVSTKDEHLPDVVIPAVAVALHEVNVHGRMMGLRIDGIKTPRTIKGRAAQGFNYGVRFRAASLSHGIGP